MDLTHTTTQAERLLNALRAHPEGLTHHEIYAMYMVGHSRVSQLRSEGHDIVRTQEGRTHRYRLVSA
jgi:DNA-directed RNA polymerase specialized sigma subunit